MHYHNLEGGSIKAFIANNRVNCVVAVRDYRRSVIISRYFAAASRNRKSCRTATQEIAKLLAARSPTKVRLSRFSMR